MCYEVMKTFMTSPLGKQLIKRDSVLRVCLIKRVSYDNRNKLQLASFCTIDKQHN